VGAAERCTTAAVWSDVARVTHYYDARAPEYDETTYELDRQSPRRELELERLEAFVTALPAGRVLDVGCGTGWLTRLLRGQVVALDASAAMLRRARAQLGDCLCVLAIVPPLPFLERSFDLVFASNVYSHLPDESLRRDFVSEAFRVGDEIVIVEEARPPGVARESWQERRLEDGTPFQVYKRYLSASELGAELGGEVVLESDAWIGARTNAKHRRESS
jgi:SAM-dependent methyltransferase